MILEEIKEDKKRKNIFLIAYVIAAMIFLVVFTINYKRIYAGIKNYEYKQFELSIENRMQPLYTDYELETDRKFNLIFEIYLIISFIVFMNYYEKNKSIIKVIIMIVLVFNIVYSKIVYSKIQIELAKNFIVDDMAYFSFVFFPIYEIIYLGSIRILKKEYKIQALHITLVNDYICWFLTILNFLLSIGGSILVKHLFG